VDAYLTGKPPTPGLIQGVWREDNGGTLLLFRGDGTVHVDVHGSVFSDPLIQGTYEIEGDSISVTAEAADGTGCGSTGFVLRASLPRAGYMRSVRTDEPSGGCDPMEKALPEAWEQVLPTSKDMSRWIFSGEHGWAPLTDDAELHGDWMAEGGGHILEIAADGTYSVADESADPVDVGTWSIRGPDLTLTSAVESAACSSGDRLVLGGVRHVDPGVLAIRGTIEQNDCSGTWTPATWVQIPSESDFP
jgi:hypothetical protein